MRPSVVTKSTPRLDSAHAPRAKELVIPLTIISEDDTKRRAQSKFQAAIDDPLTVNLVVFGTDPGIDEIIEIAVARAQLRPLTRRVIWVKDAAILSATQRRQYFEEGMAVVAIDLKDRSCCSLSKADAADRFEIELAFTMAERTSREYE